MIEANSKEFDLYDILPWIRKVFKDATIIENKIVYCYSPYVYNHYKSNRINLFSYYKYTRHIEPYIKYFMFREMDSHCKYQDVLLENKKQIIIDFIKNQKKRDKEHNSLLHRGVR